MIRNLKCFKCHNDTAILTYEENRIYKVSCPCGCEYDFEHSSMQSAFEYHNKMLELYGEIDKNTKLKAQLSEAEKELSALKAKIANGELVIKGETAKIPTDCVHYDTCNGLTTCLNCDKFAALHDKAIAEMDLIYAVRCRNCIRKAEPITQESVFCSLHGEQVCGDWYCGDGKKKEEVK